MIHYQNIIVLSTIINTYIKNMSPNVLGIRRFANPNKGFAKQRPGFAKCGCSEPWERSDLGERNPEPPNRRRSVYRLLSAGFLLFCCFI